MRTAGRRLAWVVVVPLLFGCDARAPLERPGRVARIRIAYSSQVDVGDVPSLIANRLLQEQGYRIEPIFFAQTELSVEAVARGDAEFATGGYRTYWAAVAKGAPIASVMEHEGNDHQLVATRSVADCRDLDGRRLGLHSRGAINSTLASVYLAGHCPAARPQVIYLPGSSQRAAALAAGAIDAAMLERADTIPLTRRAPERFHVVADFASLYPRLRTSGIHVNLAFARAHPETVRDYLRTRLVVNRRIAEHPHILREEAARCPGLREVPPEVFDAAIRAGDWDPEGGLDPERVKDVLEFSIGSGDLPATLTAAGVADLSFLDAVLREIGPAPPVRSGRGETR